MSKANGTLASKKDTSILVRALFEPGMLLQHEDLDQLNAYTRDLSRLLFRSFFGCGVVCGLVVTAGKDKCGKPSISVGSGLALSCNGDPIYVPKDQSLTIDEQCQGGIDGSLWVVLCGFSKQCARRTSLCSPDDDEAKSICARERDWFEIRVIKDEPKCACGWREPNEQYDREENDCWCVTPLHPCYTDHYNGNCKCQQDDCCCSGCDCVLLARLEKQEDTWKPNHRVRRFIRPVLIRDPQVEQEKSPPTEGEGEGEEEAGVVVEARAEAPTQNLVRRQSRSKRTTKAKRGYDEATED